MQCRNIRGVWTNNHDRILLSPLCASSSKNNEEEDDEDEIDQDNKSKKKDDDKNNKSNSNNILNLINPYNAGKSLRSKVETAFDLASSLTSDPASRLPPDRRSIYYNYYIDDVALGLTSTSSSTRSTSSSRGGGSTAKSTLEQLKDSSSSLLPMNEDEDYRPEVLIIGASGKLGRILVKRLLLENKVRIRVLVRDLYSSTLNKLGTGVIYCQGNLNDMESLEYAVTDVDKIVFCAGYSGSGDSDDNKRGEELEQEDQHHKQEDEESSSWDASLLDEQQQRRTRYAREIDSVGLRNVLHAYQNVRYADYGTSQAAKRTLFKFRKRPGDFGLFGIDDGCVDGAGNDAARSKEEEQQSSGSSLLDYDPDDIMDRNDDHDDDSTTKRRPSSSRSSSSVVAATQSQYCDWLSNKFGHGVFTGKVGRYGEAAIASARLRSRNDPEQGIDFRSGGFAGLLCRVCSDGGVYEAFVRTEAYERLGVEYVCEFKTLSKTTSSSAVSTATTNNENNNSSRTKWSTVRLEFTSFLPRMRQFQAKDGEDAQRRMKQALGKSDIPPFVGRDIRQLGFRYRGKSNTYTSSGSGASLSLNSLNGSSSSSSWSTFYLAIDYIKIYRGQPEPEFVYLSDARIPPVINDGMIKHDLHRLITSPLEDSMSYSIIDDARAKNKASGDVTMDHRSAEETYFKYMGEEMIKQSGLR